jgi:tripartite-type tricarboxylate transporter receptor subunit TctC
MSPTRRTLLHGIIAAPLVSSALAQSGGWPSRPLKIIIPTAAGGSPDTIARLLGSKLTERLGQPVLVESMTQGVGVVGNQIVSSRCRTGTCWRC